MNLTELAKADKLTLALAEARNEVKVTRLSPAKPKRSQLVYNRVGGAKGGSQKVG